MGRTRLRLWSASGTGNNGSHFWVRARCASRARTARRGTEDPIAARQRGRAERVLLCGIEVATLPSIRGMSADAKRRQILLRCRFDEADPPAVLLRSRCFPTRYHSDDIGPLAARGTPCRNGLKTILSDVGQGALIGVQGGSVPPRAMAALLADRNPSADSEQDDSGQGEDLLPARVDENARTIGQAATVKSWLFQLCLN